MSCRCFSYTNTLKKSSCQNVWGLSTVCIERLPLLEVAGTSQRLHRHRRGGAYFGLIYFCIKLALNDKWSLSFPE